MPIEFKVINTPRPDRFETTVTTLLNEGWELHGTPFVSNTGGMTQALTRVVKASPPEPKKSKKVKGPSDEVS